MLQCCQQRESVASQPEDLETILNNLHYIGLPPQVRTPDNVPKLSISLDLPGYDMHYLPTYWPGQTISGHVRIELADQPIKVSHLRVALYGNVQVYGKHPGDPMSNGLFDYEKNEQLINSGIRVVSKKPTTGDDMVTPPYHAHPIHENDHQIETIEDERTLRRSNHSSTKNSTKQKTPEDRHIEKLIRSAASMDHIHKKPSGTLEDNFDCYYREEPSSSFDLKASSSTIGFSIKVPVSKHLSGTFDHPHYPVSYRVVVIMKCRDKENNEITCYSTVRLRLESNININDSKYSSSIQTKPMRHYVQSNTGLMNGVCIYVLSSSSFLTQWVSKIAQREQNKKVSPNYCSSYVQAHVELSKKAFQRSQFLPIKLNLLNHAAPSFKISAIKIQIELVRRINMTCSMNEQVESIVLQTSTVAFKSVEELGRTNQDYAFFDHASMCFDLSKLIQVPDHCAATMTGESTRNVFSLDYDLYVNLSITGVTQKSDKHIMLEREQTQYYHANDQHVLQQNQDALPKEPYHQKLKTYHLQLEPLTSGSWKFLLVYIMYIKISYKRYIKSRRLLPLPSFSFTYFIFSVSLIVFQMRRLHVLVNLYRVL